LAKSAQKYIMNFTFILASSKTITKQISFNVEDRYNVVINTYKIHAKDDSNGFTKDDFNDKSIYKYFYNIQKNYLLKSNDNNSYNTLAPSMYTQYLPYLSPDDLRYEK
jgi:hypothetical protein